VTKRHAIEEVSKTAEPESYVGQVVRIPTSRVKRLPGQPRTHFDAKQLLRLQESIAGIGQQQPAVVIPWEDGSFRLRDGERRWRCCVGLRIPLTALVVEAKTDEEEFELSTAANMNRESHSPLEKALAMKRLRDGPLQRGNAEIARTFGITDVQVSSYLLAVDQLPPAVIDLMDPNKQGGRPRTLQLSAAVWLTALQSYPREQLRIATRIVRENLPLSRAKQVIDLFADQKDIQAGRGRERKPSDHLDLLRSALQRVAPRIEFFSEQSQKQIDEFFAFISADRHAELQDEIGDVINALFALQKKIGAVENIGAKRGGLRT
jgi:ParB/RepB/Spo0J family partition protein